MILRHYSVGGYYIVIFYLICIKNIAFIILEFDKMFDLMTLLIPAGLTKNNAHAFKKILM